MNKRTAAQKRARFVRVYHSKERVLFTNGSPCIVCGRSPCDNAHIKGGGMGRKADYTDIVPLCREHHTTGPLSLHHLQPKAFEARFGLSLTAEAALHEFRWQDEVERRTIRNGQHPT